MTAYIASSSSVGSRPSSSTMAASSSSVSAELPVQGFAHGSRRIVAKRPFSAKDLDGSPRSCANTAPSDRTKARTRVASPHSTGEGRWPRRTTRTMTAQHKAALAEGRDEGRAVKSYLEALQQNRPRAGPAAHAGFDQEAPRRHRRRATPRARRSSSSSSVQERMDLQKELEAMGTKVDLSRARGRVREDRRRSTPSARASRTRRGASSACRPTC